VKVAPLATGISPGGMVKGVQTGMADRLAVGVRHMPNIAVWLCGCVARWVAGGA